VSLHLIVLVVVGLLVAAVLWNLSELGSRKNPNVRPTCVQCRAALPAMTWLPFYGFLTAWRCRACGALQPKSRFLWEGLVGGYFGIVGWKWDDPRDLLVAVLAAIPMLLILIIDLRGHVLYLNSIVLALVVAAILGFLDGPSGMGSAMVGLIAGVAIAAAFFALSRWVFRSLSLRVSNIGMGDVYIAAAIGALVRGDGIVPAFAFAVIFTLLGSVLLPVVSKSARHRATAYGTYLCLGGLLTLIR
jgi:prepilin signal peptidase PulO-like enzyme (type II secretory pathway)